MGTDSLPALRSAVINFREEFSGPEEVRIAKAAALYADEVLLFQSVLHSCARRPLRVCNDNEADLVSTVCELVDAEPDDRQEEDPEWPDYWYAPYEQNEVRAIAELAMACAQGMTSALPQKHASAGPLLLMSGAWDSARLGIPASDDESLQRMEGFTRHTLRKHLPGAPGPMAQISTREGLVMRHLLGALPAFPEADWDVIRDVRERLTPSRIRFQAAVRKVADETSRVPLSELPETLRGIERSLVAPALVEIEDELRELRAIPTLLRLGSDKGTVGTALAALALAASGVFGAADPVAISAATASAAGLAAAVTEASVRRAKQRTIGAMPYWLLRQADEEMRKRI